jgi:KipI family sensor histidine kinase inhibitor
MAWSAFGDSAWLFETSDNPPIQQLACVLRLLEQLEAKRIPEVTDLVSSFSTLAVHFHPSVGGRVFDWLASIPLPHPNIDHLPEGRRVEVPVAYGGEFGPDLEAVASTLGLSVDQVIGLHGSAEYRVACIGFAPGFPYLLGLPDALCLPRRASPRLVAAGSIAIAGNQAGIYPFASPGGWHVLGRTALSMFDPARPEASLLRVGDRVRFVPTDRLDILKSERASHFPTKGPIEVRKPGALTTVQDLGRAGFQAQGVSPGGAADSVAAIVANRLVGNPDHAAVLECCMSGPVLEFHKPGRAAWVGWEDRSSGRPVDIPAGGQIDLRGPMRGVRGYIAIAGGIEVPLILGSRSTDVRAGFGGLQGRPLQSGDRLAIGPPGDGPKPSENWWVRFPYEAPPCQLLELRVQPGVQAELFDAASREEFRNGTFHISNASDRMGARLEGPNLNPPQAGNLASQPVVAGSVQIPPDGIPIVLLAERQTIGGYPQIAHVISADLPKLARAWPGTPVRFREVSLAEARDAWTTLQRSLALLKTRLDLLR